MENIFLAGDYTICFHFLWHVLLIMLQEANPKFYKEHLMMAKEGIELGACCLNNREHQTLGNCRVTASFVFGKESGGRGVPLTPPMLVGIAVPFV